MRGRRELHLLPWCAFHHDRGEVVLRALVTEKQQQGTVFAPMHWNDTNANLARIDALIAPNPDPVSGQPELKFTPVAGKAIFGGMVWFCGDCANGLTSRMLDIGLKRGQIMVFALSLPASSLSKTGLTLPKVCCNRRSSWPMSMNRRVHFVMPPLKTRSSWALYLYRGSLWRLRAVGWQINWAKFTQGQMPFAFWRDVAAARATAAALFAPATTWARLQFCRPLRQVPVR